MTRPTGLSRFVPGAASAAPQAPPSDPVPPSGTDDSRSEATAGRDPGPAAQVSDRFNEEDRSGLTGGSGGSPPRASSCEMCAEVIPAAHAHVADLESSSLLCTCRACYLLFTQAQAGRGRYRAVPDRYLHDPEHPLSAAEWEDLEIPVGLAFFLRSSQRDEVAGFYPSPAGATECRLDLAAWARLAAAHPLLRVMAADVEAALLVRDGDGIEHFVVPVDACYELAGRMRLSWRGFDGGTEARQAIAEFLATVRSRARVLRPLDRADRKPAR